MLGRNSSEPALFQMVNLEALVPEGHLLRKIDAVLDLGFVREQVAACYSAGMGRPSVDPELVVRMMLLGELYDLADRELCEEIAMHAGMRWFCRLNFHDPVPDHSTLSRLRNERWAESGLWERLRDEVLGQCAAAGMISGRHLSVDGTEVVADASMKSLRPIGPRAYGSKSAPARGPDGTANPAPDPAPDGAVDPATDGAADPAPDGTTPNKGRTQARTQARTRARTQEPQPEGAWQGHGERFRNETHRSVSDPDARLYRKGGQRAARLCYLVHDLIDTKSRVILRRRASLATGSAEREVALEMIDEVTQAPALLPRSPEILTGDANYGTGEFVADVLERGIAPHVPLLAGPATEPLPTWERGALDLERMRKRQAKVRVVRARNRVREIHRTRGYRVSRKLRIRSEHVFAEGKNEHGLGRARRRGLAKLQVQVEMAAAVQNLKRLAAYRGRRRPGEAAAAALSAASSAASGHIQGAGGRIHDHLRTVERDLRTWIRRLRRSLGPRPALQAR